MTLRSVIPCLPEPNHLRLISDCYPKSKTATEPESNALGKLSFYSQSRPQKLAKVGKALLKRSQKHGETVNGLCITLSIVKKLLDDGRKDVNVFGDEAMGVIEAGLQKAGNSNGSSDEHATLELYERAAGAFYALATFSQATAINETRYLSLLRQFCTLATSNRSIQPRIVGLHALEGVVQSELFQSADFKAQNELVVPTLLRVLVEAGWDGQQLDEASGEPAGTAKESSSRPEQAQYSRPALHERRARSIRIAKGMQGTEKPPSSTDAAKHAYKVLCQLFRLGQPRHLEAAMEETVRFFDTYEHVKAWNEREWCIWLVSRYMEWTQAQYRFEVVRFWLDQLQTSEGNIAKAGTNKQDTILAILTHLLSSPKTAVVNLAVGDVLETLSGLVVRNPENSGLRRAIAALSSHIYYPEQINDLVGDLLTDATELHASGASNPQGIIALLGCAGEMVESSTQHQGRNAKGKGVARVLSLEQLPSTLILLEAQEATVRTAYLQTLATILHAQLSADSDDVEAHRPETSKTLPSITFSNSTKAGIPLHPSQNARFARELQIRLYTLIRDKNLSVQETEAMSKALEAIYSSREGQSVLDGVPVLLAWKEAAGQSGEKQTLVAELLSDASRVLARTWEVSLIANSEAFIEHLSSSPALQNVTSLSQQELYAALSRPYTHSSMSPLSPMETLASPNRRSRSIRSNRENVNGGAETRSLRKRASIYNTSLADLKLSLGQTPNKSLPNGSHSPGRSTVGRGDRSIASSYVPNTPPNGNTGNGAGEGQQPSGVHLSPTGSAHQQHLHHSSNASNGSPTSKKRLDRIVGSLDESKSSMSDIPNPPYQLT